MGKGMNPVRLRRWFFRKGDPYFLLAGSYLLLGGYFLLLTGSLLIALVGGLFSLLFLPSFRRSRERARLARLNQEFLDFLLLLASQLGSGKSMEHALEGSAGSLSSLYGGDSLLSPALEKALYFNRLGIPPDKGFSLLAGELSMPALGDFSHLLKLAREGGGSFGEILRETGSILREQLETELEIGTLLARQQMEVKILRIIPLALLLGLKLLYPQLIGFLTGTLPGVLTFLLAGGLVAGALLLSQRFCEVEWD